MITDEILSFHNKKPKPALNVFNLKPVPKEELEKAKAASPPVSKTQSKLPPLGGSTSQGFAQEGGLLAFQRLIQQQQQQHERKQQTGVPLAKVSPLSVNGVRQSGKASADVEMLSASDLHKDVEASKTIVVDSGQKTGEDVEMLSAKSKAEAAPPSQPEGQSVAPVQNVTPPMDTKALIKAALLSSKRRIKIGTFFAPIQKQIIYLRNKWKVTGT